MAYLSKDDFLTGILGSAEDFEVPGLGMIKIRSLESIEVQQIRNGAKDDEMEMSFLSVVTAMVEPKLDRSDLEKLHKAKPGAIAAITRRIMQLSGMSDDTEKKPGNGS